MGTERVVEGRLLFISSVYVNVCIVNCWKKGSLVPSRPCLVCAVPYLNVQVPILPLWGQDRLSPRALQDAVDLQDFHIEFSTVTPKQMFMLTVLSYNLMNNVTPSSFNPLIHEFSVTHEVLTSRKHAESTL